MTAGEIAQAKMDMKKAAPSGAAFDLSGDAGED
jgi:hypothetical protein